MLQLQFEPGSMPAASTWATNVAIGGATATGCTSTGTVTDTGTTDEEGVAGVGTGAIVGAGTDVVGVVVPRTAPVMVCGVVHARSGIEDDTDGELWRLSAITVVTARVTARETATKLRRRREGEDGGVLSTMC
jgi:hypothetical protein